MSTLQSAGGFSRIKDQSEAEEATPANWPSDGVTYGILIAITLTCFVLIGGGLGVLSWRVIEERGRENRTSVLLSNNHHDTQHDNNNPHHQGGATHDDDRIMYWPVLTGKTCPLLLSSVFSWFRVLAMWIKQSQEVAAKCAVSYFMLLPTWSFWMRYIK